MNSLQFNGWAGNHFIWCGVNYGSGGLNLTISDASGNVLAQSTAYLQIVDIKQMYERWTVGDNPSLAPTNVACLASEGLPAGTPAFQYSQPQDTNTPYILFVHGWNMQPWEKDRYAETAFKRLYWQGYQGRFGSFRWPTGSGFSSGWSALTDPRNFDNSEYQAWQSAQGLLNKLNDLNTEYPNNIYVVAHSMGNVVAGEALRLSGNNRVVNTYVASQGAVSAHIYDGSVTNALQFTYTYPNGLLNALGSESYGPDTPDIYVDFLAGNSGGAGRRINFYNENDFALAMPRWGFDQITKPDYLPPNTQYTYRYGDAGANAAPWNSFYTYPYIGGGQTHIDIVTNILNHYRIFAYAAESRSTALGATLDVAGFVGGGINLTRTVNPIWPPDTDPRFLLNPYGEHFYHSAEFRGDYWQQQGFWNTLLGNNAFNLK